jgi:E3 ubiquitin-protein ligase RNF1/2
MFDIHREPRHHVSDERTITTHVRNLNAELTCPICLGIMHNTMVCAPRQCQLFDGLFILIFTRVSFPQIVMECLHRFCGGCIQKCIRVGKKECPSCRTHVPSRRSLRPDPNLDALISIIYPNLDE